MSYSLLVQDASKPLVSPHIRIVKAQYLPVVPYPVKTETVN